MKQLIFLLCIAAQLFACTAIKKNKRTQETRTDSTNVKTASLVETKKHDSTGTQKVAEVKTKKQDSEYKKTTTVKEYFGDEFDFESEDRKTHAPKDSIKKQAVKSADTLTNKKPGLRYRETVIEETGKAATQENSVMLNENTAAIKDTGSTTAHANEQTNVSTANNTTEATRNVTRVFSLWWLWLIIVLVFFAAWKYYKL